LEQNNLVGEPGFHQGFQFLMAEACMKACLFLFTPIFVKLLSPHNYFLQGWLCDFQANLPKAKTYCCIIASILACIVETMAKTKNLAKELQVSKEHN
jgi:hypothetical protein